MDFKDIQDKSDDIKRAVTQIILAASDTVEMLYEVNVHKEKEFIDIYDLLGTDYGDMVPAFISVTVDESWGMQGQIFKFRLTDKVRAHILKAGIDGVLYGWWETENKFTRRLFENFTLYKGDKLIFSCCTHELPFYPALAEINDELAPEILKVINK
ncbi:MAG: hypothetical protein K2K04_07190 [Clostridia bacterium]|nr:hypothetical protein [Clostridia bacterium]